MRGQPAAGGGIWYDVAPGRLPGWYADFTARHGPTAGSADPDTLALLAEDGARARLDVPFPPLAAGISEGGDRRPVVGGEQLLEALAEHAGRARVVGVLLVRLGGFAAGIFDGDELVASKVGSRLVHGRSAAGGQSQQRFARRREGQVRAASQAAADTAARILVPYASRLDGLVLGGDRRLAGEVLADPRLAPVRPRITGRLLDVPDPRLRVLQQAPRLFLAVRVTETAPG